MSETKKTGSSSNFLVQGSILAFASIISRLIGMVYRIPMTDTIGDLGNNYYGTAFEIYNIFLIISSYSLPIAVSKIVSSKTGPGKKTKIYQVIKGSFLIAFVSGLVSALVLGLFAQFWADFFKTSDAVYALRVLAPTLFVVAILGVVRGVFQGLGTMVPTAISQILEQIVNAIVSIYAAAVLYKVGLKVGAVLGDSDNYAAAYGAAGGTIGTAAGAVFGLIFVGGLFVLYMTAFRKKMKRERNVDVEPFAYTMKILILTIVPVILSTTIYNVSGIIDNKLFKAIALAQGYDPKGEIAIWWGVYTGKYKLMINIPIAIANAMAASAVPSLTASFKRGEMDVVQDKLRASTRLVMIIAFPCAVGLAVLARPIFLMLFYPGANEVDTSGIAAMMMYLGAVAVVFFVLSTLSNGLLQGINRLKIPVINAAIALVTHDVLMVALMYFFHMHIYAVIIANTFFAAVMCVLNQMALKKYSGFKHDYVESFLIPFVCSVVMGAFAFGTYQVLYLILNSHMASNRGCITLCTLFAIIVAIIVYAVTMLLFQGIRESDVLKFPGGRYMVKFFKKVHLLK